MSENEPPQLGVHRIVIRDYLCGTCDKVQLCKLVKHASGTETLCCSCGNQVDFDIDEEFEDDYNEPVGSCENCGTNLHESDDFELCESMFQNMTKVPKAFEDALVRLAEDEEKSAIEEMKKLLSEHYQRQDNCEKCGGTGWIEPESGDASLDIPYRCDHRTSVEILDGL